MKTHLGVSGRMAIAALSLSLSALAQTQYVAIDLGPTSRANAVAAGQQGGYTCCGPSIIEHALLWNGSSSTMLDLHPASAPADTNSGINAMVPGLQAGFVGTAAAVWSGTADSYVNIHPAGYTQSAVVGMGGTQLAGVGGVFDPTHPDSTIQHALLWNAASPAAVVDLHPGGGWRSSYAYGTSGTKQVGALANSNSQHAAIWSGTAKSVIDLHSSKFISTQAWSIYGSEQVGFGYMQQRDKTFANHALLWSGSASTVVDLHPTGFSHSFARSLNALHQVGFGYLTSVYHAIVWTGTAASAVDLHQFVPAEYPESDAFGIDASGNIVGIAGDSITNHWHAILWVPVP